MNKRTAKAWSITKLVLSIALLVVLMEEIGTLQGIVGWFGIMLLLSLPGLWQARHMILNIKHRVETAIWGKPLKLFTKEELKNTKVEIVWGKKKHSKEQKA